MWAYTTFFHSLDTGLKQRPVIKDTSSFFLTFIFFRLPGNMHALTADSLFILTILSLTHRALLHGVHALPRVLYARYGIYMYITADLYTQQRPGTGVVKGLGTCYFFYYRLNILMVANLHWLTVIA